MKRWIVSLARRPRLSVAVLVAVTLVALGGLARIRFDGSLSSLSVPDDPARVFNEEVARQFGDEEIGIVLLEADGVYTPEVIETLVGLTRGSGAGQSGCSAVTGDGEAKGTAPRRAHSPARRTRCPVLSGAIRRH
mgnify:CR=1 FL=1